ncbi:MAG TPA: hypothetical protein PKI94_06925 [Candidatus Gastranaerophilaceae bacterium]|nr:hypothetical protein [Candidatus Gastranaerophilaceae bacterium]
MLISKTNFADIKRNNKPGFGMALHMDMGKIAKTIGKEAAGSIEKATPSLEALAQDVDVFIEPVVGNRLSIKVQKLTEPIIKSKNPILNFFRAIKRQIQLFNKDFAREEISLGNNINLKILKETSYLKELLQK